MEVIAEVILRAGRAAVELALFILLPVMVVMLTVMRLLEARGVLDWIVHRVTPLLRPIGLTGLSVFAALQVMLVSFAAPVATLTLMAQRGASDRHIAATLAMVMAMAQANVTFPMTTMGLAFGFTFVAALCGGLLAAAVCWYGSGRHLSAVEPPFDDEPTHESTASGTLGIIQSAGAEAFRIATGAIPMLVLALVTVFLLREAGAVDLLSRLLAPLLGGVGIDVDLVLPALTKYIAGGTAMMGVMGELLASGQIDRTALNGAAGFLINPLDVAGVAVFAAASPRVARVVAPAVLAGACGIALRSALHALG